MKLGGRQAQIDFTLTITNILEMICNTKRVPLAI